jgi:quinol monooxygenase YgiN
VVIAVGHVHTQIPAREKVRELLLAAQRSAREQPGCVEYVFAETLDEPGHFTVIQQWRDQAALDGHYRSSGFTDYQAQIGPYLTRTSDLEVHTVDSTVRPHDPGPIAPGDA